MEGNVNKHAFYMQCKSTAWADTLWHVNLLPRILLIFIVDPFEVKLWSNSNCGISDHMY